MHVSRKESALRRSHVTRYQNNELTLYKYVIKCTSYNSYLLGSFTFIISNLYNINIQNKCICDKLGVKFFTPLYV